MTSPYSHVRIARPTSRLEEVVDFYTVGVGLPLLGRFADHAGYSGAFIGLPGADHHLEFTTHVDGSPCPAPTRDNLVVLYMHEPRLADEVVRRLAASGHTCGGAGEPLLEHDRRDHGGGSGRLARRARSRPMAGRVDDPRRVHDMRARGLASSHPPAPRMPPAPALSWGRSPA